MSPVSPLVVNLCMEEVESQALEGLIPHCAELSPRSLKEVGGGTKEVLRKPKEEV